MVFPERGHPHGNSLYKVAIRRKHPAGTVGSAVEKLRNALVPLSDAAEIMRAADRRMLDPDSSRRV